MAKPSELLARNAGRLLLTAANLATIIGPFNADWNASHIFNERWPSHARFHGVVGLGMAMSLAAFGITRVWQDTPEGRDVAAAVPLAYWGSFFPAAVVRGTGLDDEPHPVGRILGIPANVFFATLTSALAIGGWLLDKRSR